MLSGLFLLQVTKLRRSTHVSTTTKANYFKSLMHAVHNLYALPTIPTQQPEIPYQI
jgi:hypothetical protein